MVFRTPKLAFFAATLWMLQGHVVPAAAADDALPVCPDRNWQAYPPNPSGDRSLRMQTLVEWERQGAKADPLTQLVLGSFYRLGKDHPAGALVAKDVGKARSLLSNAALRGQIQAMAGMAELELANGQPLAAMIWAQAFTHYSRLQYPGLGDTYMADLLVRIYDKLPRGKETDDEVTETFAGFLATYGEHIAGSLAAGEATAEHADCRPVWDVYPTSRLDETDRVRMARTRAARDLREPGKGLYLLRINPAGEVLQAITLDSVPNEKAALGLMGTVARLRFNAVDASAPERTVLLPMSLDDSSVRFKD